MGKMMFEQTCLEGAMFQDTMSPKLWHFLLGKVTLDQQSHGVHSMHSMSDHSDA